MSVLLSELAKWATKRSSLIAILEDGKESGDHCSQQPQWKYLCVCACARAGIQFGNGYSAHVGGLSLSLSWSLLLLTGTQEKDETGADGLGVLRNTNAKGCLITS